MLLEAVSKAKRLYLWSRYTNYDDESSFASFIIKQIIKNDIPFKNLELIQFTLQGPLSNSFIRQLPFLNYLSDRYSNRLKCIDFDIYEMIEKDGEELGIFMKFISSQVQSLRRLRLGIDSKYNDRFTVPIIRKLPQAVP